MRPADHSLSPGSGHRRALRIALIYALFGAVWILVSDRALQFLVHGDAALTQAQTWKGWAYVAITAVIIYLLIRRALDAELEQEAHRREAEAMVRTVLDTMPGMLVWKDRNSRYIGANRMALSEAGLTGSSQLVGLTDAELPWREHAEILRERDQAILAGLVPSLHYELVIERATGEKRHHAVTKLPLRNAAGEITGVLSYLEDHTDRLLAEQQLRQAQKLQVIGELTSGVTHDFKNVLSVIISNAELMDAMLPSEAVEARAATHDILTVSRSAAAMVRKLLSFSRQAGVKPVPLDLPDRIRAVAPMLSRVLPTEVTLTVEGPQHLPAVLADADALEQILLNLVINSRDAMASEGTIVLELLGRRTKQEILTLDPGKRLVLVPEKADPDAAFVGMIVRDNGPGMSPEVAERSFEPYFSTRVGGTGTGLGLSMVHGLMLQQAGILTLQTRPGAGTAIGLYFPVDPSGRSVISDRLGDPVQKFQAAGETILLVDDQPEVRRVGGRVLRRFGYEVLEAASGEEALAIFARDGARIGLMLTDLVMPEMNGLELIAEVRARGYQVPVALSSGDPDLAEKAGAASYGEVPMISKPWTMEDLGAGVQALLANTRR